MGEAEGGLAALAVAEKENEIRDQNYLGAIAISDVAGVKEIFDQSGAGSSSLMLASLAYGIKTVYPLFQASDILTGKGTALYQEIGLTCSEGEPQRNCHPSKLQSPTGRTILSSANTSNEIILGKVRPSVQFSSSAATAVPPSSLLLPPRRSAECANKVTAFSGSDILISIPAA